MYHHEPFPPDARLEHPVLIAMQDMEFASAFYKVIGKLNAPGSRSVDAVLASFLHLSIGGSILIFNF